MSQHDEQPLDALEGLIISEAPIVVVDEAGIDQEDEEFEPEVYEDEMYLSGDELAELRDEEMIQGLPPHLRQKFSSSKKAGKNKKHKPAPDRGSLKGKKRKQAKEDLTE